LGNEQKTNAVDHRSVWARVDEHAAGAEHSARFCDYRTGIVDVLEDFHADHGIERGIGERELLPGAPDV
jgi:hypothetical protein